MPIDYSVRDFIVAFGRSRQRQRGGQQREALCRCVADNKRGSATGGLLNRSTQYIISSRHALDNAVAPWPLEIAHLATSIKEIGKPGSSRVMLNIFIRHNAVGSYFQPCALVLQNWHANNRLGC